LSSLNDGHGPKKNGVHCTHRPCIYCGIGIHADRTAQLVCKTNRVLFQSFTGETYA